MAAERIRVFIAGNIYVKRALVRRFLEDDGYEVTGEARDREDMVASVRRDQPDAVVIDDELLAEGPGGGTMGRIRRAAPDAKVVVFTSSPTDASAAPQDADGYLEKGLGLSSLTALLGRLFAEAGVGSTVVRDAVGEPDLAASIFALTDEPDAEDETDRHDDPAIVGASAATGAAMALNDAAGSTDPTPVARRRSSGMAPGAGARLVAIVVGSVLIVWGLTVVITSGGEETPVRAVDRTDTTGGTVVEAPTDGETTLDQAYTTLDDMIAALEGGNYVLATVDAQVLMDLRDRAVADGFALTGIDAEVTARLEALVGSLPERVTTGLADILGSLYPVLEEEAQRPGGGSDVVIGTTVTGTGGDGTDGSTNTGGDGDGADPGDGTTTPPAPQPGDGRVWGQSHRPDGGWHGHKPDHPHAGQERTGPGKPPWAGP